MILTGAVILIVLIVAGIVWFSRMQAAELVQQPVDAPTRIPSRTPEDLGLAYEEIQVTTADGLNLVGWHLPSQNGAAVLVLHGFRGNRASSSMDVGAMLHRHGYGVVLATIRGHDRSDGDRFDFTRTDEYDLAAWFAYLKAHPGMDTASLGILGHSLGGALAIRFAARNPDIKAIVTHSAPVSFNQTLDAGIRYFTGLPSALFSPFIIFWLDRDWDMNADELDQAPWIKRISPRPIFLIHGGADVVVGPDSGHLLLEAADEPKELWYEPALGHVAFYKQYPDEFEERVAAFFDRHLLDGEDRRTEGASE